MPQRQALTSQGVRGCTERHLKPSTRPPSARVGSARFRTFSPLRRPRFQGHRGAAWALRPRRLRRGTAEPARCSVSSMPGGLTLLVEDGPRGVEERDELDGRPRLRPLRLFHTPEGGLPLDEALSSMPRQAQSRRPVARERRTGTAYRGSGRDERATAMRLLDHASRSRSTGEGASAASRSAPSRSSVRILGADRDRVSRRALEDMVRCLGYACDFAEDGERLYERCPGSDVADDHVLSVVGRALRGECRGTTSRIGRAARRSSSSCRTGRRRAPVWHWSGCAAPCGPSPSRTPTTRRRS